ncbi:MAG: hypothetical protein ACYDAM_00450 [Leptospirales bacterium]
MSFGDHRILKGCRLFIGRVFSFLPGQSLDFVPSGIILFFSIIFLLAMSVPNTAHATPFTDFVVYPYETPEQGEVSIGTWQTLLLPSKSGENLFNHSQYNSNMLFSTYVFEFGVTDWWTLGTYEDFVSGASQSYSYYQTRAITSRIRFPRIPDFIDPAIQIEYWAPTPGAVTPSYLDLILIGEKKIGRFVLDINTSFFFETASPGGGGNSLPPDFEYSSGLYYLLADNVNFGVEAFGATGPITNMYGMGGAAIDLVQQHYIFQSWNFAIGDHIDWNIGVGTGLTASSAPLAIKTIFEYHFKPFDFGEKEGEEYKEEQNIH